MKVFISSTYKDLTAHRDAVFRILHRLSQQHRAMEYFGAKPDDPKSVCFDEIAACQAFVGIYAHRYGWVPAGDTLSITEQEFDFARSKGLDMYCYVVDPEFPWPPRYTKDADSPEMRRLLQKTARFVRASFTTPDDLAKQVAADLKVGLFGIRPKKHVDTAAPQVLWQHCRQEITATVGRKYIRDLYVSRELEHAVIDALTNETRVAESLSRVADTWKKIDELLRKTAVGARKASESPKQPSQWQRKRTRCMEEVTDLSRLPTHHHALRYPSHRIDDVLASMRSLHSEMKRSVEKHWRKTSRKKWEKLSTLLTNQIESCTRAVRPVMLVVDRAGGGKTNMLCRITEQLGPKEPCVFFTGRSIVTPTLKGLLAHLASVYRIGEDPVERALDYAERNHKRIIVIIDAINENLHPTQFNAAFKAFVRRYYHKPVLYLVSCRDIYWTYFQDQWWTEHCSRLFRDNLYSFSPSEQDQALALYFESYHISGELIGNAREQLRHPLLLRFFCEAFAGAPNRPSSVGEIADIRLLELFDAYCDRKFRTIRERLCLMSSDEIFLYLEMIAMMMLQRKARLVPVRTVARRAREEFGEATIRSVESRYVQILDEDLLIEEQPTGSRMHLQVGFVYDEFMEYVIARGLWAEMASDGLTANLQNLVAKVRKLLSLKDSFVSVLGIVVYLGELLAREAHDDAVGFAHWLIEQGHHDLAVGLVEKWPYDARADDVFAIVTHLHNEKRPEVVRQEAWETMQRLCLYYWDAYFSYVKSMPKKGNYRFANVFVALRKASGGPSPDARFETLKWICRLVDEVENLKFRDSQDNKSAMKTIKEISARGDRDWTPSQKRESRRLLRHIASLSE